MSCMEPFAQITGTARIYIAPERTAPPDIGDDPASPWVYLGETDGDQTIQHAGALTFFRTNERSGPVAAVRPEEDIIIEFTLVETTYEHYAYVINNPATSVTSDSSPVPHRRMQFKRGDCPAVFALLMIGNTDSPYGVYPAYNYLPRVVSNAEPTITRAKDGRAALEAQFYALEDPQQAAGDELGWAVAQTGV